MQQNKNSGLYINGRAQAIELIKYLGANEKKRLLMNIRRRNPDLAADLSENTLTFTNLEFLEDDQLQMIFHYVSPKIIGMALKRTRVEFQRRMLKLAPRHHAQEAYSIISQGPIKDEHIHCEKAQMKVLKIILPLFERSALGLL